MLYRSILVVIGPLLVGAVGIVPPLQAAVAGLARSRDKRRHGGQRGARRIAHLPHRLLAPVKPADLPLGFRHHDPIGPGHRDGLDATFAKIENLDRLPAQSVPRGKGPDPGIRILTEFAHANVVALDPRHPQAAGRGGIRVLDAVHEIGRPHRDAQPRRWIGFARNCGGEKAHFVLRLARHHDIDERCGRPHLAQLARRIPHDHGPAAVRHRHRQGTRRVQFRRDGVGLQCDPAGAASTRPPAETQVHMHAVAPDLILAGLSIRTGLLELDAKQAVLGVVVEWHDLPFRQMELHCRHVEPAGRQRLMAGRQALLERARETHRLARARPRPALEMKVHEIRPLARHLQRHLKAEFRKIETESGRAPVAVRHAVRSLHHRRPGHGVVLGVLKAEFLRDHPLRALKPRRGTETFTPARDAPLRGARRRDGHQVAVGSRGRTEVRPGLGRATGGQRKRGNPHIARIHPGLCDHPLGQRVLHRLVPFVAHAAVDGTAHVDKLSCLGVPDPSGQ